MGNIRSNEALMIAVMNHLSEKMGRHAILKGGMALRLLDCPRYTNDLDYVFIPFKSKKEIVPLIREALKGMSGVAVESRLHSTNAQFDIVLKSAFGIFKTQVEANVSEECESQALSTGDVARRHQLAPHVIRVMRFDIMLAHKLAAWNERRLMRDLYDIYFIHRNLNELPDIETLKERLQEIRYAKGIKASTRPAKLSIEEFLIILEKEAASLTGPMVEAELKDYMDIHQLAGLDKKIKVAIMQMIEKMSEKIKGS